MGCVVGVVFVVFGDDVGVVVEFEFVFVEGVVVWCCFEVVVVFDVDL